MSADPPLTLGTAGHVDHGKTTLVGALTGKDTDRLSEEKERGLSIELGYAPLHLPSGRRLSVVDVPGHERFVRTMVAGATGIDAFLLCVAADDGFMPQTREHLAVLRALGVERGVVAMTKADLAPPDRVAAQVAERLPGIEAIPVAAPAGAGLDELLGALDRAVADAPGRAARGGVARLHVDRVFTLRGIGTVVTGTLWSGCVSRGEEVMVLPQGIAARVRSVQVHDQSVETADAGQRVALALAGVGWRQLERGDVVCDRDCGLHASYRLDAAVSLEPGSRPVATGTRVQVHHGTREAPARVVPLEGARLLSGRRTPCQLRLEAPLIADRGDAVVLRQIAPPDTIGGGEVLDPSPARHGPRRRLAAPPAPPPPERQPERPSARPANHAALRLAELLRGDGERPRADADLEQAAGLDGPAARRAWRELEGVGLAVRVARNLHFDPTALDRLLAAVVELCRRDGGTTIAEVRDALATSRRYAQALLEHLDATKVTVRRGDRHVLRRRLGPATTRASSDLRRARERG
ncbi:MAG: selenocysteine-specific translation elongation factor [Thermoleophilaceae bacterium]|nr:selenocysteine-specific translation elongation factor [Thermoleophilaceae bacterium]